MSKAKKIDFFGKIYGTKKDYLIASGQLDYSEDQMVYWVTDSLLNDWVQLPECTPQHINAARMFKHVFSGDLGATVASNPPFPGKERHYLRAQLQRIAAATQLAPDGMYEIDDAGVMKGKEDFSWLPLAELREVKSWVNMQPSIQKNGLMKVPNADEEEGEPDEHHPGALRTLDQHKPYPGMETAWLSKVVGDTSVYNQGEEATVCYASVVLKSLRWPGAMTVAKNQQYCNIYVGYGQKKGDSPLTPTEPPVICKDPDHREEHPEPYPLHEPAEPVPEPDSDAPEDAE